MNPRTDGRTLPGGTSKSPQPNGQGSRSQQRMPTLGQVDAVLSDPSNATQSFAPLNLDEVAEVQQVLDLLLHACVTLVDEPMCTETVTKQSPRDAAHSQPSTVSPLKSTLDDIAIRLSIPPGNGQAPAGDDHPPLLCADHALMSSLSRSNADYLLEALRRVTVEGPTLANSAGSKATASPLDKDQQPSRKHSQQSLPCGGWLRISPNVISYAWKSHRAGRRLHGAFASIERQLLLLNIAHAVLRPIRCAQCIMGGHRVSVFEVVALREDTEAAAGEVSRKEMNATTGVLSSTPRLNHEAGGSTAPLLQHDVIPLLEYIRRVLPCSFTHGLHDVVPPPAPNGTKLGWLRDGTSLVLMPSVSAAQQVGYPSGLRLSAGEGEGGASSCIKLSGVTPSVFCCPLLIPLAQPTSSVVMLVEDMWKARVDALLATFVSMTLERQPSMMDLPSTFVRDCFHSHGVRLVFLRFVRLELVRKLQKLGCGYWGVVHRLTTEVVARTLKHFCREYTVSVTSYASERKPLGAVAGPGHQYVMEGAAHNAPLPAYMNKLVSMFLSKPKFVTDVLWPKIAAAFPVVPFLSASSVNELTSSPAPNLGKNAMFLTSGHASTPAGPSSLVVSPAARGLSPGAKPLMPTIFLDSTLDAPKQGATTSRSVAAPPIGADDEDVLDGDASEFDFAKVSLPDVLRYLSYSTGVAFSSSTKQFEPTLQAPEAGALTQSTSSRSHLDSQLFTLPFLIKSEAQEWERVLPELNRSISRQQQPWGDRFVLTLATLRPLAVMAASVIASRNDGDAVQATIKDRQQEASALSYEIRRHSGYDAIVSANNMSCGLSLESRSSLVVSQILLFDVGMSEPAACDRVVDAFHALFKDYAAVPPPRRHFLSPSSGADDDAFGDADDNTSMSVVPRQRSLLHWMFDAHVVLYYAELVLTSMLYRQQLQLSPDPTTRRAVVDTLAMCSAALSKAVPFQNQSADGGSATGLSMAALGVTRMLRIIPSLTTEEDDDAGEYYEQRTAAPEAMMRVLAGVPSNTCVRLVQLLESPYKALLDHLQFAFSPPPPAPKRKVLKKQLSTEEQAAIAQAKLQREVEERRARRVQADGRRHANTCMRLVGEAELLLHGRQPSTAASVLPLLKFLMMTGFGCGSTVPAIAVPATQQPLTVVSTTNGQPTPRSSSLPPQGDPLAATLSAFPPGKAEDVGVKRLLCPLATTSLLALLEHAILSSLQSVEGDNIGDGSTGSISSDCVLLVALFSLPHICASKESAAEVAGSLADVLRVASFATKRHVETVAPGSNGTPGQRRHFDDMVAEAVVEKVFESEDWLRMIHEVCMEQLKAIVEEEKTLQRRKSSMGNVKMGRQQHQQRTAASPTSDDGDRSDAVSASAVNQKRVKLICQYIMGAMEASPGARDLLADVEVVQYPIHRKDRVKRNVPADVMSALVGGPTFATGRASKRKSTVKPANASNVMILRRVPSVFGVDGAEHHNSSTSGPVASQTSPVRGDGGINGKRRQSQMLVKGDVEHEAADGGQTLMVQSTDEALKRLSMAWSLKKQAKERERFQQKLASERSAVVSNSSTMRSGGGLGGDSVSETLMHSLTKNALNVSKGNRSQQLRMARAHAYQTEYISNAEWEAKVEQEREQQRARRRAMEDRRIERWKEEHPEDAMPNSTAIRNISPIHHALTPSPYEPLSPQRIVSPLRSQSVPPPLSDQVSVSVKKHPPKGRPTGMPAATSLQRVRENARAWAGGK